MLERVLEPELMAPRLDVAEYASFGNTALNEEFVALSIARGSSSSKNSRGSQAPVPDCSSRIYIDRSRNDATG